MKNILIGQSGGPTAVINASLYGVIKEAAESNKIDKVYGMVNGIEGFIKGKYMDLNDISIDDLEILKNTPASFLGSCRYKLPNDYNDDTYNILFKKFKELNVEYVVYIGGNDSMDTVNKLANYAKMVMSNLKIIGIPKTIDNDLPYTDHTPGFGSAAKFVATMVRDITLDAEVYDKKSVTLVEIMGRHAGWLTAASVLSRKYEKDNPALIYLPEVPFDIEKFYQDVQKGIEEKKNVVVCVSEGIKDKTGKFICEYETDVKTDIFGHKNLAGCAKTLENMIKQKFDIKVRSVELNVTQRCSAETASLTDVEEAVMTGREGVKAILKGETSKMICFKRTEDSDKYKIEYITEDVNKICNKEKTFPEEWISIEGNDINKEFENYAIPLIAGDTNIKKERGLPVYLYRKIENKGIK